MVHGLNLKHMTFRSEGGGENRKRKRDHKFRIKNLDMSPKFTVISTRCTVIVINQLTLVSEDGSLSSETHK